MPAMRLKDIINLWLFTQFCYIVRQNIWAETQLFIHISGTHLPQLLPDGSLFNSYEVVSKKD